MLQGLGDVVEEEPADGPEVLRRERVEDDDLVDPVRELRRELPAELLQDHLLHLAGRRGAPAVAEAVSDAWKGNE